jgi:hypothetical protein
VEAQNLLQYTYIVEVGWAYQALWRRSYGTVLVARRSLWLRSI